MIIRKFQNFTKDKTVILVYRKENNFLHYPFLNFFNDYDKRYILNFLKNVEPQKEYLLYLPSGRLVIVLGEENKEKFNHRKALKLARRIIVAARNFKQSNLIVNFSDFKSGKENINDLDLISVLTTQFELANFEFVDYKNPPPNGWFFVSEIQLWFEKPFLLDLISKAIYKGKIIGEEINEARKLSNMPGGEMTPTILASAAKKATQYTKIKVKVLDEKQIKNIGMNGILGVSRGSSEKPKFIIMEYQGNKKDKNQIVLVGKGITFDSGGLNLKPSDGIYEMHMDMSGGAAVIHITKAMARLGINKNIVGLIPACENMPSGSSYRPGDLLKTLSGKTIEVLNTDAEGRIILADALSYAQKFYNPSLIIDIATLTGAAMVALGQRASAIFSNKDDLVLKIKNIGELVGDYVWQLPLWEEYESDIKGTFGDVANVGKTKYGGAITGAIFLYQFIKKEKNEVPWVHLDIAPRMTAIEGDYLARGSAGPSIGLLCYFISGNL